MEVEKDPTFVGTTTGDVASSDSIANSSINVHFVESLVMAPTIAGKQTVEMVTVTGEGTNKILAYLQYNTMIKKQVNRTEGSRINRVEEDNSNMKQ